jgi:predicted nucleotidyltransferase
MRDSVPQDPVSCLTGPVGRLLQAHRPELLQAAARYDIRNVRVFGSTARNEDGPDSDLDLLIDLPDGIGRLDMEDILGIHVDLVPETWLKPRVRARVDVSEVIPL